MLAATERMSEGARDPRFLLASAAAATGVSTLPLYTVPLVVGALIDQRGYTPDQAGYLLTGEIFALSVTALLLSPRIGTLPWRRLVGLASVLVIAGNVGSVFVSGADALLLSRMIAGVGGGMIFACGNAALAASVDRARHYAKVLGFGVISGSVGLAVLPFAIGAYGVPGAFGSVLAISLVLLPVVLLIPKRGTRMQSATGMSRPATGHVGVGVLVVIGALITSLGQGAFIAFVERMGLHTGLSATVVGQVLSITNVAGLLGAGFAAWLGLKAGYLWPIAAGIFFNGALILLIAQTDDPWVYSIALFAELISLFVFAPFQISLGATLSPGGQWATAAAGTQLLGSGLGPAVGGIVVASSGYASIGWWVLAGNGAAILLYFAIYLLAPTLVRARETVVLRGGAVVGE